MERTRQRTEPPADQRAAGEPNGTSGTVRMLDIAASLGVSRATVSLAMRDSPLIAGATRDAVLAEADRLGYVYHRGAASLRSRRTDVVALVIPDVTNPFVAEVSLGAQEVLTEQGCFVAMINTQEHADEQRHMLRSLVEQRVAGVVMIPVLGTAPDDLAVVTRAGTPVVLMTRDVPGSGLALVAPDEAAAGRLGVTHLAGQHGCRSLGYFGGNESAGPRIARAAAFARAAKRADVQPDPAWSVAFDATLAGSYDHASALLAAGPPPHGLVCHSDLVAHGVLRALADHGLGSDDCRVVAIDDLRQSALSVPRLTTVAVDPIEQGRISARILLRDLGHRTEVPARTPTPVLRVRESCGCGATPVRTGSVSPRR